jgi:hypothetical protein
MQLTPEYIKKYLELVHSTEYVERRKEAEVRYNIYQGKIKPYLQAAIMQEFTKKETINELMNRMCTLNICKKIIQKTAQVYTEDPLRQSTDGNELDIELIEQYEKSMLLNIRMKEANRLFKLDKKVLGEIYLDDMNYPRLRILPSNSYEVFSESSRSPEIPGVVMKYFDDDKIDTTKHRYAFYSDESFVIVDNKGIVDKQKMEALGNENNINPFGTFPFVFAVDSSISVNPIIEDDLIRMSIGLPVILTDVAFGLKYQTFGILYIIGANAAQVDASPSAIMNLPQNPDGTNPVIGKIAQNIDMAGVLSFVETNLAYLLSSRGLKTDTLQGKLTASNPASGVSKALDSAELLETTTIDQSYFVNIEQQLWNKLHKFLIPEWMRTNQLPGIYNRNFTDSFEINIQLTEPRIVISAAEQVELSKKKIDYGFSTLERELYHLYPDYDQEDVQNLMDDIAEDDKQKALTMINNVMPEEMPKEDMPMDKEENDKSEE